MLSPLHSLQQSLLVLLSSNLLRKLFKSHLSIDYDDPRCSLRCLLRHFPSCFEKVGYVSKRFFESTFLAAHLFFESNTFPVVSRDIPLLSSIAALFAANIRSIFLIDGRKFKVEDLSYSFSSISGLSLRLHHDCTIQFDFMIHSCPLHLLHLKKVDVLVYPMASLSFFSKALSLNHTIRELNVYFYYFSFADSTAFEEVFSSNTTLTNVTISYSPLFPSDRLVDDEFRLLCIALEKSTVIELVDFSGFSVADSNNLISLLKSRSIRRFKCPIAPFVHSTVFTALNASFIRELSFRNTNFSVEDLCDYLKFNLYLKKLEISECAVSFQSFFKFLESNSSLSELILNKCKKSLNESHSFVQMLQYNQGLLVLNLDESLFKSINFQKLYVVFQRILL
ncbi:hypothetical protein GEMRC1_007567 [Eukaryota sp. GEM-RC1]